MKTGLSKFITITLKWFDIRFYATPQMAEIWIDASYQRKEEVFISRYVKTADTVIDVGANIGLITLACSHFVGPQGKVYSIEAHPRIFKYLEGNVSLNGRNNVSCHNYAVSDTDGIVEFSDNLWDEINSVVKGENQVTGISISAQRLDAIVSDTSIVALLKIDVEGFEKFVLLGAERILLQTQCVYFESNMHHYNKYGYECADIIQLLVTRGFFVFRFFDSETLVKVDMNYNSIDTENLVAVKDVQSLVNRTGLVIK